jgi:hypothetical protein
MRDMSHRCLLIACLVACAASPAQAQDPAPVDGPGSIQARLDASGIRYEIDPDGDFKIMYSWRKESRSQLVYVAGSAEPAGGMVVRQVFAPAARIDQDGLDAAVAAALLRDNGRRILGHWATNDTHLLYVIDVPDNIDAAGLETAISSAAEIADDKEIELTQGGDEF